MQSGICVSIDRAPLAAIFTLAVKYFALPAAGQWEFQGCEKRLLASRLQPTLVLSATVARYMDSL